MGEEKMFRELREKIREDIQKRKKYVGPKAVPLEEEIDEIEAEIFKSKGKKKRKAADKSHNDSDTNVRIKKAKGKQPTASESMPETFKRKTEKRGGAGLDEDAIRGLNTSLANKLSLVKTKLMNVEERERHMESEMGDLRKIVLDQQVLIKKLLVELNEVKKEVKVGVPETKTKINEMVSIEKYPKLKEMVQTGTSRKGFAGFSGVGGSGTGKETEVTDDFCLDIDTDLGGEEVVADKEKGAEMKLMDEEVKDEQLVDYDSEPEFYETEEKEMVYLAQRSGVEGDVFELDKSNWFRKVEEPETVTPLFQNMDAPTSKDTNNKIFSWKFNLEMKKFMIKRRGGDISYVSNRKHFKTFPKWDLRHLAVLPLINAEQSDRAKLLEEEIQAGLKDNLKSFGYNKMERKRSKKDLDWVTGKGKIVLKLKLIKTTRETVVCVKDGTEWRLFDPMEVFGFSDDDLKILCENPIRVGAGAETKKEAALFERVANWARGIRPEVKQLAESVQKQVDLRGDVRELTDLLEGAKAGAEPEDPTREVPP
ncbi:hypothetical protein QVD17_16847 [Tagetes erecta]|uniref:Uncharacterized protein n=1 Tax=Tagetes erecta TaxID=13708 RepID=A0AAD8KXB0_TARER|nr:hypothetical protein QVD17_16847 [Tagetes erecta]